MPSEETGFSPEPEPAILTPELSGPAAALAEAERIIADRDRDIASLMATVARYENAVSWNTSCTSCAAVLDSSILEHDRAEVAEAQLAVARAALHRLSLNDEMAGMGQRDDDPEAQARCAHAAGALATIARLAEKAGGVR